MLSLRVPSSAQPARESVGSSAGVQAGELKSKEALKPEMLNRDFNGDFVITLISAA